MASLVASWSKDPSTKCGALIVRPDRTIASVGFNGFPRAVLDTQGHYDNRDYKYARMVHAEMNAIIHAREPLQSYTMYTHQIPMIGPSCDRCTAHVIQAGIKEIVYSKCETPDRWKTSIELGLEMYREAGVEVRAIG